MRHFPWIIAAGLAVAGAAAAAGADGWQPLFDGKSLDGWTQRGGKARYTVEGDAIVGRSVVNTENSFLCTNKEYGDFILEYEFKVDPRLNSGVQIRSKCFDEPKQYEWNGKTIKVPGNRVHGYQIEIDPDVKRGRMWSAGIYDEARRGWLCPGTLGGNEKAFSQQGMTCFKPEDWNKVRVEAIGPSIRTWLNDTPCASVIDDLTPRGLIGLQVHGIGNKQEIEGSQVSWRSLRLMEIAPGSGPNSLTPEEIAEGWCLLWDGATPDGWRGAKLDDFPASGWTIKDGALIVREGGGGEAQQGGDIVTRRRFARFDLQFEFRITDGANSGVKYFCQPNLDPVTGTGAKARSGSAIGLEYQVLDDARHPDAKLGRNGNRTLASLYDLIPADPAKTPKPVGEWNHARIVATGPQVEHWLNGAKVLSYQRGSAEFRHHVSNSKFRKIPGFGEWPDGHILLQDHGNNVDFRNLKICIPPVPRER